MPQHFRRPCRTLTKCSTLYPSFKSVFQFLQTRDLQWLHHFLECVSNILKVLSFTFSFCSFRYEAVSRIMQRAERGVSGHVALSSRVCQEVLHHSTMWAGAVLWCISRPPSFERSWCFLLTTPSNSYPSRRSWKASHLHKRAEFNHNRERKITSCVRRATVQTAEFVSSEKPKSLEPMKNFNKRWQEVSF